MSPLAISPDNHLIARITTGGELEIAILPVGGQIYAIKSTVLALEHHLTNDFVPGVHILRLAPESDACIAKDNGQDIIVKQSGVIKTWLLLASKHRLVVLHVEITLRGSSPSALVGIVVDVEFPQLYGKITSAELVFGHRSAFILFDIAPHASILSLVHAERDDVPNRKFSSSQGYSMLPTPLPCQDAQSTSSLALLTRDKHIDGVVVMDQGKIVSSFKSETTDAQEIRWSPDGCPILMILESPAYGLKVRFTTAFGHPLRLLDISPESSIVSGPNIGFPTVGASIMHWVRKAGSRGVTTLVFGDSAKNITLRTQDSKSLVFESQTFKHPKTLRGMRAAIWHETGPGRYEAILSGINIGGENTADVELISVSPDGRKIASRLQDPTNVVFIWERRLTDPVAAIVLQNEIQQLLWDDSSIGLCIVTSENKPNFHYCADFHKAPVRVHVSRLEKYSSNRWRGQWLDVPPKSTNESSTTSRSLFMISSKSHFDVLFLSNIDKSIFSSVFDLDRSPSPEPVLDPQSSTQTSVEDHNQSSIFF